MNLMTICFSNQRTPVKGNNFYRLWTECTRHYYHFLFFCLACLVFLSHARLGRISQGNTIASKVMTLRYVIWLSLLLALSHALMCKMRPITTDRVAWSVSAGHVREHCKNGWIKRDADWRANLGGPKEPQIRWGQDTPQKSAILRGVQLIEKD